MQYLKDEVRNRIISSALCEFNLKGFQGASMRDIAKNAGVALGSVYRYFENKDQLFNDIMEPAYRQFTSIITDVPAPQDFSDEKQSLLIRDAVDRIMDVYRKYSIEFFILIDKSKGSKFNNIKKDLILLIDARMKEGILPQLAAKGIKIKYEFLTYVLSSSLLEGIFIILREYTDEAAIKYLISQLLAIYLNKIIERFE